MILIIVFRLLKQILEAVVGWEERSKVDFLKLVSSVSDFCAWVFHWFCFLLPSSSRVFSGLWFGVSHFYLCRVFRNFWFCFDVSWSKALLVGFLGFEVVFQSFLEFSRI